MIENKIKSSGSDGSGSDEMILDSLAPQRRFISEGDDEGSGLWDVHMPVQLFSRFTLEVLVTY